MAKVESKLDDVIDELATTIHNLVPGDVGSMDRVLIPIAKSKQQIKALMLELIESCDSDDGSGPDLIFRSEITRKVKEL